MGYIGVIAHLLAIVGHMFTKSVHQPLGNFKSKNVSLVFSQKSHGEAPCIGICLPAVISISCCNGPTFHRWCQDKPSRIWNRKKQILDHLAQGAPTTNRSLMWWASRGPCDMQKNTWITAGHGLSRRVQDHPEQYCILTSSSQRSVKQSGSWCSTTQGPSSPPKGKILWKRKIVRKISYHWTVLNAQRQGVFCAYVWHHVIDKKWLTNQTSTCFEKVLFHWF